MGIVASASGRWSRPVAISWRGQLRPVPNGDIGGCFLSTFSIYARVAAGSSCQMFLAINPPNIQR